MNNMTRLLGGLLRHSQGGEASVKSSRSIIAATQAGSVSPEEVEEI
jgi:hypothetical protein